MIGGVCRGKMLQILPEFFNVAICLLHIAT
jgi:hypothetical protein